MKQERRLSHNFYCQHFLCTALLTLSNSLFSADTNSNSLADQITDTQRLAEQLQSQLKSSNATTLTPASTMPGQQKKMMPMGMMGDQKSMKTPAGSADSMGGNMSMMDERKGMGNPADNTNSMRGNMGMMGRMKSTGMNNADSKLPAFPGNKHLYHLGANNFFLDSIDTIGLTSSQQQQLKQISLNWQNADQQYNQKIEQAEQDLWQLTGSDVPNSQQIEQKVREIETIQTQERIAFIQAVGKAATVLTVEQRLSLTQTGVPPESMLQQ